MTIEYNKIKVYNNELLSKTNTEKSENNTNLLNNSNKKPVGCYKNTKKVMTRISLISLSNNNFVNDKSNITTNLPNYGVNIEKSNVSNKLPKNKVTNNLL